MPHYCADCWHEYDELAFQAIAVEGRRCPECGSTRINAVVQARTAGVVAAIGQVTVLVGTNMWAAWLRIAVERTREARRARDAMMAMRQDQRASGLAAEFEASLVAIAACAHALDAFYGSKVLQEAIDPATNATWKSNKTPRHGRIREALKRVFNTGPKNAEWVTGFDSLFDLRDMAAHAEERHDVGVPHPIGGNASPRYIDYGVESAETALDFTLSVFEWCVDHPRTPEAKTWADAHRNLVTKMRSERSLA